jgi:PTH2 family peptidyl-tRNA hydrolase
VSYYYINNRSHNEKKTITVLKQIFLSPILPFRYILCEFRTFLLKRKLDRRLFGCGDYALKQRIIIRTDLGMTRGREIAQGASATQKLYMENFFSPYVRLWTKNNFTKVALAAETESQIIEIFEKCRMKNLPATMVRDYCDDYSSHRVVTAIAIGPGDAGLIEAITRDLQPL